MHTAPVITMTIALWIYGHTSSSTLFVCNYWEDEHFIMRADCSGLNLRHIPVVSENVSYLDLSTNLINVIENNTFSNLSILHELNLSYNQLEWLDQEAFLGLKNLKRLILGNNLLMYTSQHFSKSVFKPLKSLTYLDIGSERSLLPKNISTNWFSKHVMSDLTTVQSIVIDFVISDTDYVFREEFLLLTNLTNVKTGDCSMEANNKTFLNVPNVETLDLSMCVIFSYAPGTLQGRHLKYFSLAGVSDGFHDDITFDILKDFTKSSIQTLVLTQVYTYNWIYVSEILFPLRDINLQILYVNQNNIKITQCDNGYCNGLPSSLKNLDCSSNELSYITLIMPNLKRLNLERNNLRDFLKSNTYYPNNSICYPTNLTDINLSFNNLYYLKVSLFHGHRSLSNLNLSNNFFTDINFDICHLKSLKVLDLSNNKIQKFSKESIEQFNVLFDASDIRVYLAGNSLQCSCDAIDFIMWILDKNKYFSEKSKIKCKFLNETEIFLIDFKNTMLQLKKNCASRVVLISAISVAIVSMIIVMTIGIIHRYRWRLRYIYYMTKSKYVRDSFAQNDDRNYMYDAFISYSDDEQDFIINECIPFLEKRDNVKLCIHKRDFLPGKEILHNITDSIHESRYVICILTKSFLESYYCMFEFNMARMESIYSRNGNNLLFLVFYEQLRTKDIPLVMLELVENDSYIEYPKDEQGNIVFWDKLKEAMT